MKKKRIYIRGDPDIVDREGKWIKTYCETTADNYIYHYTRSFCLWNDMIARSDPAGDIQARTDHYIGTTCDFGDYQIFTGWCQEQIGYMEKHKDKFYQLDKDLLIEGNKVYSENTCLFVPSAINCLFLTSRHRNREYPVGVYLDKKMNRLFAAGTDDNGKFKYLCGVSELDLLEGHRMWQKNKIENVEKTLLKFPDLHVKARNAVQDRLDKIKFEYENYLETKQ